MAVRRELIEFNASDQSFPVYLVQPDTQPKGAVIVIHEVWGLNDHTKDVASRLADLGYIGLAPDLLSETDIAKYAPQLQLDLFNPAKRNEAQPKLRALMSPIQSPDFKLKTLD